VKPFYSGRIASKLMAKHTSLLTKNRAFEHKYKIRYEKMAKVTKWRPNTIPVAINSTLFGQKQLDLEGSKPGGNNGSTCGKKGYFTWHKKNPAQPTLP
jgi:hypothetical protein